MKEQSKQNRILVVLNSLVLLCLAIAWILYTQFGHRLIEAMYKGESLEFLNSIIEGQSIHPLAHYLQDADRIMWVSSFLVVGLSSIVTLLIKTLPSLIPVLEASAPLLSRCTLTVLTTVFCLFSLAASAIVFFYPLEIETRESTVWLHVLALKQGINIFDHTQVAFNDMNHGPLGPLFKFFIATLFPFLESWQVTRSAVFVLPYVFLLVAWKLIAKSSSESRWHALYLGSIGYLFLMVSAREFLFVGRSDATAAILLMLLVYISSSSSPKTELRTALHGFVSGAIGISVVLTNWRITPAILAVFIITIWIYSQVQASRKLIPIFVTSYTITSLGIWGFLLYTLFDFNLSLYYKHFVGFFQRSSGIGGGPYSGSVISFLLSLFNPTAPPDSYKGGPLLLILTVYLLIPRKRETISRAWGLLSCFLFVACTLAYYLKYHGGGAWYFIPFLIILWFYLCTNYSRMEQSRLTMLGICVLVLICVNVRTVVFPTLKRAIGMEQAYDFMTLVRSLQNTNTVLSEDTFFFRTSYKGELIDMGDNVSRAAKSGYFGEEFNKTVKHHFERTRSQPPDYIVTGFAESPELRTLIQGNYILIAKGPDNLTANGHYASKLFKRKELIAVGSAAYEERR